MKSIRGRLILWLVAGVIVLQVAAGAGLFSYVRQTLERSLDAALLAKATAIQSAVQMEDGVPKLQLTAQELSEPAHHDGPFYFQIWRADGSTLARFAPDGSSQPMPTFDIGHRRFSDVTLAGGIRARAVEMSFFATPDEDDPHPSATKPVTEKMRVVVAHDRRSLDQPMAVLLTGLLVTALIITLGIVGIVMWGVGRGLRPLVRLAAQVERVGPQTLQTRFPAAGLPLEIWPITEKLNQLLDRLEQAFIRERRFSADVAHELRTPLAELRSLCEISLRWPDSDAMQTVSESLAITRQMEETVLSLLALVRIQAGAQTPQLGDVDLGELIQSTWRSFQCSAEAKRLKIEQVSGPAVTVQTDRGILTQVLRNLLANAVQHTPEGGRVVIETIPVGSGAAVCIRNAHTSLVADDLVHLREPFWRKDSARTDHRSSGLGLAIVDEYCRAIRIDLELKLVEPAWFEASVRFKDATLSPGPKKPVEDRSHTPVVG